MNYFVTATDLKQNLSHYLSLVDDGPVSITKNGKIVAVLVGPQLRKELAMRSLKGILSDRNLSSDEIRNERLEKLL